MDFADRDLDAELFQDAEKILGVVLVLLLGVFVVRFGRLAEYAEGRVFIVAGRFRGVGVTGFF